MWKRLFSALLSPFLLCFRFLSPGSASGTGYGGSRKLKQRYQYNQKTMAGFIELSPNYVLTVEQFRQSLTAVAGVERVIDHPKGTKEEQGNRGDHFQLQNFYVYSSIIQDQPVEFFLTCFNHIKDPTLPYTITAGFREPRFVMLPEAWRILREVCKGKELLPDWVASYHQQQLAVWRKQWGRDM